VRKSCRDKPSCCSRKVKQYQEALKQPGKGLFGARAARKKLLDERARSQGFAELARRSECGEKRSRRKVATRSGNWKRSAAVGCGNCKARDGNCDAGWSAMSLRRVTGSATGVWWLCDCTCVHRGGRKLTARRERDRLFKWINFGILAAALLGYCRETAAVFVPTRRRCVCDYESDGGEGRGDKQLAEAEAKLARLEQRLR